MHVYKFRNCFLNTLERSVIRDDQCLELTTRTFDVLQFLIENAGKVVTKDELLGNVWNGSFVEESNLPVHISRLRRSLGESKYNRFIETVQGSGYRFVAPVVEASNDDWHLASSASGTFTGGARPVDAAVHSLAVLPIRGENDGRDDYLTDGLTENLIDELSRIPSLRVIARTSVFRYKDKDVDIKEVGAALGTSRILTGRIRLTDDDVIVSVELIRTRDGSHIWGRNYKRKFTNLMTLHEEIAVGVSENIVTSQHRLSSSASYLTRDPESYRLYLKGRHFLEKHSAGDMHRAIHFFHESLHLDPENIYSNVEIVECYRSLYTYGYITYREFLQKIEPMRRAITRRGESIDVVQVMYCDLKMLEWKFDEAQKYCRQALAINPNCLKGRLRFSDLLMQSRQFLAALEQLKQVMIIDPLSALIYKRIGRLFYVMGEYENSIAFLNDALDLEPLNHEALSLRGAAYTEMHRFEEALQDFETSLKVEHHSETLAMIGTVFAKRGLIPDARRILQELEVGGETLNLAFIYLELGETDKVYESLERAFEKHEPDLRALTYDRRWSRLREDARFITLVERVGLPTFKD